MTNKEEESKEITDIKEVDDTTFINEVKYNGEVIYNKALDGHSNNGKLGEAWDKISSSLNTLNPAASQSPLSPIVWLVGNSATTGKSKIKCFLLREASNPSFCIGALALLVLSINNLIALLCLIGTSDTN